MIRQYLRQALNLMHQEKLFSSIYIVGTGLAVSMVMALSIALTVMFANVYPETNRDRMLICDYGMLENEDGSSFSSLSTNTIHKCFDGMKDVETMSVLTTWNEQGKVQLDRGREMTINSRYIDGNFWKVFSFDFVNGCPFTESDLNAKKHVAVISESLAKRTFGSVDVVGKDISYDFIKYRVVGVVKDVSGITRLSYSDIWFPYNCWKYIDEDDDGVTGGFSAYILVKEGADIKTVQKDAQQRINRFSQSLGKGTKFWCMDRPYTQFENFFAERSQFPVDYTNAVVAGLIVLLMLLIIPAVNLSGMTDSRMERRMAELGVRRSFGASKATLIKQIIVENMLFTFLGGIIGLVVSYILLYVIDDMLFNLLDPMIDSMGHIMLNVDMLFNPWIFVIVLTVCFVLNLCSALIPAWKASHHPITESLHPMVGATMTEGRGMSFFTRIRKNAWIGIELMLVFALMWFITDYLFMMEFHHNLSAHMNTDRVWKIEIGTISENNPDYDAAADSADRKRADFELIMKAVSHYKDVEQSAVLIPSGTPFAGNFNGTILTNPNDTVNRCYANTLKVYPHTDYFRTFDYTSPDGKPVSMHDFDFSNPNNVVLSQRTADYLFPEGNAIGKTIRNDSWRDDPEIYKVVGVVGNVKRTDYERPESNIYITDDIMFHRFLSNDIAVRLKPGVSEQTFADRFIDEMSKSLRIGNFYLREVKSFETSREELNSVFQYTTMLTLGRLMASFFLINIILCVMGTFWYRVRMRREEIGVRMAMGASKKQIKWMLFKEGLVLLTVAAIPAIFICLQLVIGEVVDYGLPKETMYPEYIIDYPTARFIITNVITWIILALTILVSIWIPAYRAVQLAPADALHDE